MQVVRHKLSNSNKMEDNNFDVIVVGAGISGLTAAYHIKKMKTDTRVIVLEGKDRVGGRTLTVPLVSSSGTESWDLGGQWVGRKQVEVVKLLEELDLKTYPQFTTGIKLQQVGEARVRSYSSKLPNLSPAALLDLYLFMTRVDKFQSQICVDDPCSHPRASEWDALSLGAYLDKNVYTRGARSSINATMRCMLGCETEQISFLYFLLYIHMTGGIYQAVEAAENSAQEWKIEGGAQQISFKLAECLGEDAVRLGDPVMSVVQTESEVTVSTAQGWTGSSSFVILAMPPQAIEHISFSPDFSADRVNFMKHMPMGHMIKVIITYEKPFWRHKSLSGEVVSDIGKSLDSENLLPPLCITFDASSCSEDPALVGFIGGNPSIHWAMQPAEARKKAVLDHLALFFGPEAYTYLAYEEKNWSLESCSWGAPISYLTPGNMPHFARAIRRNEGRIHFAGTETATRWSGFMNGAVQAGQRSAYEVLRRLYPSMDQDLPTSWKCQNDEREKCEPRPEGISAQLYIIGLVVLALLGTMVIPRYMNHRTLKW